MAKVRFSLDNVEASKTEVAEWASEGRRAVARQTRKINDTSAAKRAGRHARLTPEEKAERRIRRTAKAARRKEELETLREAAKIRRARRRAREEEESAGRRRRLIVTVIRPPKVTARGGRKLYRRYPRFERTVLPTTISGPSGKKLPRLVFRIKTRSLGGTGQSRWRRREGARFARNLVRLEGLEASPGESIATNIVATNVDRASDEFVRQLTAFMIANEDTEAAIDPEGQVYKSIIVPLPHEVGLAGRIRIRDGIVAPLEKRGVPFLAVLHAPDPGGDSRNYHLHLQVSLREFEQLAAYSYAFAETKNRDLFHPAMLNTWRRFCVSVFNRELAANDCDRRFTLKLSRNADAHQGRVRTQIMRADRDLAAEDLAKREAEVESTARAAQLAKTFADATARLHAIAHRADGRFRHHLIFRARNIAAKLERGRYHISRGRTEAAASWRGLIRHRNERAMERVRSSVATTRLIGVRIPQILRSGLTDRFAHVQRNVAEIGRLRGRAVQIQSRDHLARLTVAVHELERRRRVVSIAVANSARSCLKRECTRLWDRVVVAKKKIADISAPVDLSLVLATKRARLVQQTDRISGLQRSIMRQVRRRDASNTKPAHASPAAHAPTPPHRMRVHAMLATARDAAERTDRLTHAVTVVLARALPAMRVRASDQASRIASLRATNIMPKPKTASRVATWGKGPNSAPVGVSTRAEPASRPAGSVGPTGVEHPGKSSEQKLPDRQHATSDIPLTSEPSTDEGADLSQLQQLLNDRNRGR